MANTRVIDLKTIDLPEILTKNPENGIGYVTGFLLHFSKLKELTR